MSENTPSIYNGRYELRSQIARGGTAQVYLAHDILLDRPVALKVLYPELSSDHSFVERFRREAQAAANLSHPNIVPIFDWGESSGSTYFIVMEYVDGEPLSSLIRTQAPIEASQAANAAADVAKALSYAHRHGVVHRDIKPGNILITQDGLVKVTDFGIARAIGADEQVTQSGLVMGTATYFSPEQAQGLEVDGRSDLYSLGVVLYEMVTARTPFSGDTPVAIAYQHVREQPPTPRSINPNIPTSLEAIILQAMAKLPAERYRSADELKADLDRFVRGQTVLAAPPMEAFTGPATEVISAKELSARLAGTGAPEPELSEAEIAQRATTTRKWTVAAVALAIAIILIIIFGGRQLGYFGGAPFYNVPKVVGLKPAAAESALKAAKLVVSEKSAPGSITDQHTVIKQNPTFPNTVKAGSTVEITVAGAAPVATVPKVIGKLQSSAESALKHAGFRWKAVPVSSLSGQTKQYEVVAENPSGGISKPKGTTVTISYVQNKKVSVPSIVNDNEAKAGSALTTANLNIGTITMAFNQEVPTGDVISTSPTVGSDVREGTSIALVISEGPGVTVPSLIGDSSAQAIATITELGLRPDQGANVATQIAGYVGNVALQRVSDSNAKVGDQIAPGSVIIFRLGVSSNSGVSGTTGTVGNTGTGTTTTTTTTTTIPVIPPPPG
jgi:serine/threonine-protein kinase